MILMRFWLPICRNAKPLYPASTGIFPRTVILGIASSLTKYSQVHQLSPSGRAATEVGLDASPSRTGQLAASMPGPKPITHQSHALA